MFLILGYYSTKKLYLFYRSEDLSNSDQISLFSSVASNTSLI